MECFCSLDSVPHAAETVHSSPLHGSTARPHAAAVASHSSSCDAFDLLKHPWETSSAAALSLSSTHATPSSKHFSNALSQATPLPSSNLSSLSSSFLPQTPLTVVPVAPLVPPVGRLPPPLAPPSYSLLDTARRLPNDVAAYRVRIVAVQEFTETSSSARLLRACRVLFASSIMISTAGFASASCSCCAS